MGLEFEDCCTEAELLALDDWTLLATDAAELLDDELDCAAAALEEDVELVVDDDAAVEEAVVVALADAEVEACVAALVGVCFAAELVDWGLSGHKAEIIAPLKILPRRDELLATTPPQLSMTPFPIVVRPATQFVEHRLFPSKSLSVHPGIVLSYAMVQVTETVWGSCLKSERDTALAKGKMRCSNMPAMSAPCRIVICWIAPGMRADF